MLARRKDAGAEKTGFLGRLHAWWEGYDVSGDPAGRARQTRDDRPDAMPGQTKAWTRRRLRAAQRLCGAGNSYPGGAAVLVPQLDALGLDDGQVVGNIGMGLAEIARMLADRAQVRLHCVDPDRVLVEAAKELIEEADLGDQVSTFNADFFGDAIAPKFCDVVLAREALLEEENKADALRTLHKTLKPKGTMQLFDFMDKSGSGATLDVDVWSAFEQTKPHLVPVSEYTATLEEFGYEVDEPVDISDKYCQAILVTLHNFASGLEDSPVPEDLRAWVMWEVEYWARRAQILESGDIGYFALRALAPEGDDSVEPASGPENEQAGED